MAEASSKCSGHANLVCVVPVLTKKNFYSTYSIPYVPPYPSCYPRYIFRFVCIIQGGGHANLDRIVPVLGFKVWGLGFKV